MNVHFFYLSLLAIAAGFIGYLKLELDANLEKFENGKQALTKNFVQLKETIRQRETELEKCKKSNSVLESVRKEAELAKMALNDLKQNITVCAEIKATIESELVSLKDHQSKFTEETKNIGQQLKNCASQAAEAVQKSTQDSANLNQCQELRTKCEQDKAAFSAEYLKWKKLAEDTSARCQADKNNLIKTSEDLKSCQQIAAQLQNEKNQFASQVNLCSGEIQKCETDKVTCLQVLESERIAKQQQVPIQQQQQVPPQQQQQVPPQQQQQAQAQQHQP